MSHIFTTGKPIEFTCERLNCGSHIGKDYIRKKEDIEVGWEDEPIFLCDKHSVGYTPISLPEQSLEDKSLYMMQIFRNEDGTDVSFEQAMDMAKLLPLNEDK